MSAKLICKIHINMIILLCYNVMGAYCADDTTLYLKDRIFQLHQKI